MNLKRDVVNRLRWLRAALLLPPMEEESLDEFSERVVRETTAQSADQIATWVSDILSERQNSREVKFLLGQIKANTERLLLGQGEIKLELAQISADVAIIKAHVIAKEESPVRFNFSVGPIVNK
jgi:hypothetical protein